MVCTLGKFVDDTKLGGVINKWLGTEKLQSHRCACAVAEAPVLEQTGLVGFTDPVQQIYTSRRAGN